MKREWWCAVAFTFQDQIWVLICKWEVTCKLILRENKDSFWWELTERAIYETEIRTCVNQPLIKCTQLQWLNKIWWRAKSPPTNIWYSHWSWGFLHKNEATATGLLQFVNNFKSCFYLLNVFRTFISKGRGFDSVWSVMLSCCLLYRVCCCLLDPYVSHMTCNSLHFLPHFLLNFHIGRRKSNKFSMPYKQNSVAIVPHLFCFVTILCFEQAQYE